VPRHSRPGVRGRPPHRTTGSTARHRRAEKTKHDAIGYQQRRAELERRRRLRRRQKEARDRPSAAREIARPGWVLLDGVWVPGRFAALLHQHEGGWDET
jgi:hypothetical protein